MPVKCIRKHAASGEVHKITWCIFLQWISTSHCAGYVEYQV